MSISERIEGTIENWRIKWGDALKTFLISFLSGGMDIFAGIIAKSAAPKLKPFIDKLEEANAIPPELKPLFDELKEPSGEFAALLANSAGSSILGAALGKVVDYYTRFVATAHSFMPGFVLPSIQHLLALWWRKALTDDGLSALLRNHGLGTAEQGIYKALSEIRFPSATVTGIWRRDKPKYNKYWNDLRDQAWTPDRIDVMKELSWLLPSVADYVYFARRDIFAKDVVDFYDYEGNYPKDLEPELEKIGIKPEIWKNHWMAHWRDIEWSIANLLLHRGEINEEQHKMILRTANYPPGILDKMLKTSWDLPNRIETRMMARYGLVDKAWLVGHLKRIGLAEEYRDIAADFMLAMGVRMDISARYSKGWLTKEQVKAEIDATGLSPVISDRLYKWIVKNVGPEQTEETRALTKTEIYKGIKAGTISPEQGVELLMDLNYDRETAEYLVEVNVGVLAGSPSSFDEFKKWTQDWRIATGQEAKPMPEEIKQAAAEVVTLTEEVEALTRTLKEEEAKLVGEEPLPEAATARVKELRVSLHRAEAELAAAKDRYETLVAEWKHGTS